MSVSMTAVVSVSGHVPPYKGKVTHRSWPQLPEELVRHIATFYLWDLAATSYCPQTWDMREFWHPRMVYTSIRDALELEKNFMSICPQWSLALETHLFWQQAIALIDPVDHLAHHAVIHPKPPTNNSSSVPLAPIRLTPYRHFRNITGCSCIVCRINAPGTSMGLTTAKRNISTPFIGPIALCREHDRRRVAFCGLCLREAPVFENVNNPTPNPSAELLVGCLENEDEESWPGVEATCKQCRSEWLWRRVCHTPRDKEAIGGTSMISEDWETRQSVDGFVDLAEGSISDVIALAREKWWLRKYTRLGDMMQQALAAARFNNTGGRGGVSDYGRNADYGSLDIESFVEEEEEEEEDDDEEDSELMQMTEESGVRDLALGDWARSRILDGFWISPADIWYSNAILGQPFSVPAIHPCPWTREQPIRATGSVEGDEDEEEGEHHPTQATVNADMPPSFALCEQAYAAHQRQLRVVLLPPMRNIVRRLVMECGASEGGREDPAVRATRMTMEEVLQLLREEEGVWFDGVDWAEKRRNDEDAKRRRQHDELSRTRVAGDDDTISFISSVASSSGSSSEKSMDGSNATSPVLSTSTLQTTPSPPPLSDEGKKDDQEYTPRVAIPVSPVLDPPRLLRPIPYVPLTTANMPHYSMEAFRVVWREACSPLYHCRCKICERAMAANPIVGDGNAIQTTVPSQRAHSPRVRANTGPQPTRVGLGGIPPVEIKLHEAGEIELDGEGEDEVDETDIERHNVDESEEAEEEDSSYEEDDDYGEYTRFSSSPPSETKFASRKRSSDELELEDEYVQRHRYTGTPPKRFRSDTSDSAGTPRPLESPTKLKKRSSEELDEVGGDNKRVRVNRSKSPEIIEGVLRGPASHDGIKTSGR